MPEDEEGITMEKAKCTFCEKINEIDFEKFKLGVEEPDVSQIVKDIDGFHWWESGGGDPYQAGVALENIHYCPMCGRRLDEEQSDPEGAVREDENNE